MERFQPKLGEAEEGEGGTIVFLKSDCEARVRRLASRSSWPARTPGLDAALRLPRGHLPHLRRRAEVGRDPRPAHREGLRLATARSCAPASTPPRAPSRSNSEKEPRMATEIENPLHRLTRRADRGDRQGVRRSSTTRSRTTSATATRATSAAMIELHRRLAPARRASLLVGSRYKPLWVAGTATLSLAKILENMEIGHNVLHGQWDWMNDPVINSPAWDWDTRVDARGVEALAQLRPPHVHEHPRQGQATSATRSCGSTRTRSGTRSTWSQPFYNLLLMALFEWGVALARPRPRRHPRRREVARRRCCDELKGIAGKARAQIVKDYVAWPAAERAADGDPARRALACDRRGALGRRRSGARGGAHGAVARTCCGRPSWRR